MNKKEMSGRKRKRQKVIKKNVCLVCTPACYPPLCKMALVRKSDNQADAEEWTTAYNQIIIYMQSFASFHISAFLSFISHNHYIMYLDFVIFFSSFFILSCFLLHVFFYFHPPYFLSIFLDFSCLVLSFIFFSFLITFRFSFFFTFLSSFLSSFLLLYFFH